MSEIIRLATPFPAEKARALRAGDRVLLTGVILTARDAAHRRLMALLDEGKDLPVDFRDAILYYVGPCPARPGEVIGSAGPTTSGRMDPYTPRMIREVGIRGMIGKGARSEAVAAAMRECGAVYFAATGGAGALIARRIKKAAVVAFPDLGPEAIHRLEVEDFPLVVAIDSAGGNLYAGSRP